MHLDELSVFETPRYKFHYQPGSYAESYIAKISSRQEFCRDHICKVLGIDPTIRIQYYLLESPEHIGEIYGDGEPCNGFTRLPDSIFAVYSPAIQCTGFHEDAHILSYTALGRPRSAFVREGLAMYFDKTWNGFPNISWTRFHIDYGTVRNLSDLHRDACFFEYAESVTYPIAGAYTEFLITRFGMESYKAFYSAWCKTDTDPYLELFKEDREEAAARFLNYIRSLTVHTGHLAEQTEAEYL